MDEKQDWDDRYGKARFDAFASFVRTVFVSIKGGSYARFRRALDTGNLTLVRAAAAELPTINLEDALPRMAPWRYIAERALMRSSSYVLALLGALGLSVTPAAGVAMRRVPVGFYGVMYDGAIITAPRAVQDAELARMARSGVESVRAVFPWAAAQPPPGPIDFTGTDQLVGLAAAHRLRVLPVVIYAPRWAALNNNPGLSPPRNPADYAAYLRALVRRYGPCRSFSAWA